MVQRHSGRGLRGLSNTLAGLIILSFMLVAVLPFIVNVVTGGAQASLRVASLAAEEVKAAKPSLNVTLDVDASTANTKVYKIENIGSKMVDVEALLVEASNGQAYVVVPGNCTSPCTLPGTTTIVDVDPAVFSEPLPNGVLRILPRGLAYVKITNGRLLGVVDIYGGYVTPQTPTISQVTVAQYAEYAAVAGSVQTNYFQLSNYTDLSDLLNSNDVALVTDPADETSDPDILWQNMLESVCLVDGDWVEGGFQPLLVKEEIRGILVYNIQPLAGGFVIGGAKPHIYSEPYYGSGFFGTFYSIAPFNYSSAGVIAAYNDPNNWFVIFLVPDIDDIIRQKGGKSKNITYDSANMYSVSRITNDYVLNDLLAKLGEHVYNSYATVLQSVVVADSAEPETYRTNLAFDTRNLGLVATVLLEDNGTEYITFYCPPHALTADKLPDGYLNITLNQPCPGVYVHIDNYVFDEDYVTAGAGEITGSIETPSYILVQPDAYIEFNGTYIGSVNDGSALARLNGYSFKKLDESSATPGVWTPIKVKVNGLTSMLQTKVSILEYDYTANDYRYVYYERNSTKAFGFYYYSGAILPSGTHVSYGIHIYGLVNASITLFEFEDGATSGLEAYTMFLDTDSNGLNELIFMTEDNYVGYSNTVDENNDELLATLGLIKGYAYNKGTGCLDYTPSVMYLKFLDRYAVNGSEIAQVSVQVRYKFHDAAGDDVDDVDDPMEFLMTFRLIDSEGNVYSTTDYIYQQLMGIEDTWPPNMNWVSDSVFLLVPNENKMFYIVFGVNDPYAGWREDNGDIDFTYVDDLEFTIAIEWLGMWYLHR
ncbi:MAG: hypothetical protein GXO15_05800 [Crenarchaeota archaeon]|nr:hypothetical protein [Thermoproteota archaeon]